MQLSQFAAVKLHEKDFTVELFLALYITEQYHVKCNFYYFRVPNIFF